MPRRVALVVNRLKPRVAELEPRVRAAIEAHGEPAGLHDVQDMPADGFDADAVVVIGGDGTLLNTARASLGRGTPLIGVNAGRLGFMAAYDVDTLEADAERLFGGGELEIDELPTLCGKLIRDGASVWSSEAVNEFVVTAGPPYRMIALRLGFDGVDGPNVNGDGLIVSTPLGSTAYNVSAGGPIAAPGSAGMIVTPIAAHSLAFRPLVLGSGSTVEIEIVRGNENGAGQGSELVGDGQVSTPVIAGDAVRVSVEGRPVRFVRNPRSSYWTTLIDKMGWGANPIDR